MAEEKKEKSTNLTSIILVVLLMAASFLAGFTWIRIREEKQADEKKGAAQATPSPGQPTTGTKTEPAGVSRFVKTNDEVCREANKPLVYMFGSSGCPHCQWEHPIFTKATAKFGSLIAVHDNMDKQEADNDIWQKYSSINQGSVPFLLLGCRYAQLGSGDKTAGETQEEKNITALICKLTDNQPQNVCNQVKELVDQAKD